MEKVLYKFPYGIYVMGVRSGQEINAMIASWVTQVSGDPDMVAVAVKHGRRTNEMLQKGRVFTLALLAADQAGVMNKFKGEKVIEDGKMNDVPYELAENGAPVPADCVGYIELALEQELPIGNHTLFVGRVTRDVTVNGGQALNISHLDGHYYAGK